MLETNDLFYRYFVLHRNYETNFPPFVVACSEWDSLVSCSTGWLLFVQTSI